ncbi:MAG: DUF5671 domain-containing protein [bacterium]
METETTKPKTTPRDFFLNLGSVFSLYVATISLLNLLFSIIEKVLPDQADYLYDPYSSGVRMAIAFLIITFPIHIYLTRVLRNDFSQDPEKKKIGVRKWLIYFTLFVAGTAISIDLITLVYSFLEGELTLRFILKVVSVFTVSYFIIKYYLLEIKDLLTDSTSKKFEIIATVTIILSIVIGFYITGSPFTQRMRKFDDIRVSDLQSIQGQIVYYWQQKEVLPNNLTDLTDSISGFIAPTDPETKKDYTYEVSSTTAFKICANFNLTSEANSINTIYPAIIDPRGKQESWSHKDGYQCFNKNIDPELYSIKK